MPVKKMTVDVTRIDVDAGSYFLLIKIGIGCNPRSRSFTCSHYKASNRHFSLGITSNQKIKK